MITERLKKLRESKNLTHTQVAEYLGITRQAYTNYENGEREIKTDTLRKLVGFFNTSADYLLGTTDDPTPSNVPNTEKTYDSLAEITQYIQQLGINNMGFFDIEKWKNLSPEDVEEIKKHFDYVLFKAIQNKQK
ncbi:helix-turn-helix domain-containing protein [Bacillus paramycoides]|uniref:Helix-turn-helix domain-containing protein n=1 Tax=Bacillus paramycoides TaxID=2026194 RepID=A0ABU6MNH8_9BACI|nr:helix-turn-helix domain-containing protein [Bacillus paramycoides]MED1108099.1 helix-turn-helix domain-containing protein [Bacillus paramycoides]MED1564407.1 helix-turn-helix domain-containing protein [Bacillus paramycoides]